MPTDHIDNLQDHINLWLKDKNRITVLEAGCGSSSNLSFNKAATLVGIDISESQLRCNDILNRKILGNIEQTHFKPNSFDAIVCWDVLEHLPSPKSALHNFFDSTGKDGIIILKVPNVYSLKGILTKFLPYRFHLFIFKFLRGSTARRFRTYLRHSTSPMAIIRHALRHQLKVIYFDTYDMLTSDWFIRNKGAYHLYMFFRKIAGYMSFGGLGDSEYIIVLQKQ